MARSEKFKLSFAFSAMLIVLGMAFVFAFWLLPVRADQFDSIGGWGWSENIGWISMNCDNPELPNPQCDSSNYGVHANLINGGLSGYAWSQLGWITFSISDPADPKCPNLPLDDCDEAHIDVAPGNWPIDWSVPHEVIGWAQVVNTGEFISLNCRSTNDNCASADYRVTYNNVSNDQQFRGWAWGTEPLGWISFNCDNPQTSNCVSTDYNVFKKPTNSGSLDAEFDYCREPGLPGTYNISFFDKSTPVGGIDQWFWTFGDGSTYAYQNPPMHTFPNPTTQTYNVSLTVTDLSLNIDSEFKQVDPDNPDPLITPSCQFFMNTVSPISCTEVGLDWDMAFGAVTYQVWRNEPGCIFCGGPVLVATLNASDPNTCNPLIGTCHWEDTLNLRPETDYEYWIRAVRSNGSLIYNSTATCTGTSSNICPTAVTTPPCVVSNVTITPLCGRNDISWQTVPVAAGHNIYRSFSSHLQYSQDAIIASSFPAEYCGGSCEELNPALILNYTDPDVLSDVDYYYSVSVITEFSPGVYDEGPQVGFNRNLGAIGTPRCYRGPVYIEQ